VLKASPARPPNGSTSKPGGGLGEFAQSYLSKGRLAFVEGRFQTDRYEQEGETRTRTKVVATQVQALDRRPEEPEAGIEEQHPEE
jgi:single-strand DNA-binding protein